MNHESERERLSRRIGTVIGTDVARELSRYRRDINKLPAILDRGVRAFPTQTSRGTRYRAADETQLCHSWLDEQGVAQMHS